MEVNGQFHSPTALPPGKESPTHIVHNVEWAVELFLTGGYVKILSPCRETSPGHNFPPVQVNKLVSFRRS
jgi:hypothetical protein